MSRMLMIGGGIGGLTAARALSQAGFEVSIFEQAPALDKVQVGGAIHVWHNGMRGLQKLGLGEQVAALGGPAARVQTAEMRNWKGKLLSAWSVASVESKVGAPTVGVIRPELHRVLVGGVAEDDLHLGRKCVGFSQNGSGVEARFEDGSVEHGDVLIGADGLRSAVRSGLLGDQPLRFARYASWQAVCSYADEATPEGLFWIVWGPGARFLFYRVGASELYWEGIFAADEGGSDPPGAHKQAALERFAGWTAPVEAIIEATDEQAISRHDVYDRPPVKRWGEGRVTLLGDAAHPMTNAAGQGANTTIEDSVVLASRLKMSSSDLVAGLRAYEAERVGRTARIANLAWRLTAISRWSGALAVGARDRIIPAMMVIGKRAQAKDMEYAF
jgi:2-polyprenyl-6-methoxyphenol hydroxylase-like FAD-dependent oxidoreductase